MIEIRGIVGGDWFSIGKATQSYQTLDDIKFNVCDYYIIKATNQFRLSSKEDFLIFKYAKYILFKKDKYNLEHINKWLIKTNIISPQYLNKPFPNFDPDKIKIISSL